MAYFKQIMFGRRRKEDSLLASDASHNEAIEEEVIGAVGGAEIFDDFDNEKAVVEEWWLQKGVEEAIEEEPEEMGEGEGNEGEKTGTDDLIYSLKAETEVEDDDENMALRAVMEEMGEINADELLDFGRTVLSEMEVEEEVSE